MFTACPKCRHTPLPANQALPAACPACGLILAKFKAAGMPGEGAPSDAGAAMPGRPAGGLRGALRSHAPDDDAFDGANAGGAGLATSIAGFLFQMPTTVSRINWQGRIVLLVLISLWSIWIFRDYRLAEGHPGSTFLHLVLTPFHESGHYLIFRWFGQFIMTLGGTLGQHLMPIVLGITLLAKRRDAFGAAICFWLLGFSVADMGIYMYDAFDPKLMLLDGKTGAESDGHDWQNIFGDLGLSRQARAIGRFSSWCGAIMMLTGLVWAGWMLRLQQARLSDSVFAEEDDA